jgi:peptidoglycan hydrolase-like protein with peptidoglycan-binding domain
MLLRGDEMSYSSRYLRITDLLLQGPDVSLMQQRLQELGLFSGLFDVQKLIKAQDIVTGNTRL